MAGSSHAMTKRAQKSRARRGVAHDSAGAQRAIERVALALERLAPPPPAGPLFDRADAFSWHPEAHRLVPVPKVNRVEMALLKGIDRVRDMLLENTERFARGLPANNALLWGARGMGKSSLVKAVHASVSRRTESNRGDGLLKLVEIHREDIESLPELMALVRARPQFHRVLRRSVFRTGGHQLQISEGNAGRRNRGPAQQRRVLRNVNRRHLMPREMVENERSSAINPGEAVEEKVSLSDRFGLWLGFHRCSQDEFLAMVDGYVAHYNIEHPCELLHREALEWATTRGARSGRVAWQFVQDRGEAGI